MSGINKKWLNKSVTTCCILHIFYFTNCTKFEYNICFFENKTLYLCRINKTLFFTSKTFTIMKKIFSFLPNLIPFLRERENIVRSMIASIIFLLFFAVNGLSQCFTATQIGCAVQCVPPSGVLASWASGGLSFQNSGSPSYVGTFTAPSSGVYSITLTTAPINNSSNQTTCVQNITIPSTVAVGIAPTSTTDYSNNAVTVSYQVCLTQGTSNVEPINLYLSIPNDLSISGGNFDSFGNLTIPANTLNNNGNQCIAYTAILKPKTTTEVLACKEYDLGLRAIAACRTKIEGNYSPTHIENPNQFNNPNSSQLVKMPNNSVIDGTFTIDAHNNPNNYLLYNTNIWMKGANSSINIKDAKTLNVFSSNIRGCAMWQSIFLGNQSSLLVGGAGLSAKIEDAVTAVDMNNAVLITSSGAEFNNNETAVYAYSKASLNIQNTTFRGGVLKNGKNPKSGIYLFATILADKIIANQFLNYEKGTGIDGNTFGMLTSKQNRFINNDIGIRLWKKI